MDGGHVMEAISNSLDFKEIGIRVRSEREKYGLTREGIAEIIGLSPFYIGQIERGDRRMSLETLYKVSDSLNISIDFLLKGEYSYIENIIVNQVLMDNLKNQTNVDIQEIISLLEGSSKENIRLIIKIAKLILPHLNK